MARQQNQKYRFSINGDKVAVSVNGRTADIRYSMFEATAKAYIDATRAPRVAPPAELPSQPAQVMRRPDAMRDMHRVSKPAPRPHRGQHGRHQMATPRTPRPSVQTRQPACPLPYPITPPLAQVARRPVPKKPQKSHHPACLIPGHPIHDALCSPDHILEELYVPTNAEGVHPEAELSTFPPPSSPSPSRSTSIVVHCGPREWETKHVDIYKSVLERAVRGVRRTFSASYWGAAIGGDDGR